MSINELRLSNPLILKMREYNLNSNQMIALALCLNNYFSINKLAYLMHVSDQVSFKFDRLTHTFELIDPEGLMGEICKTIHLEREMSRTNNK